MSINMKVIFHSENGQSGSQKGNENSRLALFENVSNNLMRH